MKNSILATVFIFCLLESKAQTSCDSIPWSASLQLSWSNFSGPIDSSISFKAYTYSGIHFGWSYGDGHLNVQTGANYYGCKSWVKEKLTALLEHERLHFDITECYRRVLLQRISQASFTRTNCSDKLNSIYSKVNTEWQEAEKKYDDETNHGVNKVKQGEWEKYIHDKLQNLRSFGQNDLALTIR